MRRPYLEETIVPATDQPTIHADTNVDWLLECVPSVVPVFVRRRLHCVGCPLARFETLTDVCDIYGLSLDDFLDDLRASATGDQLCTPQCC